MVSSLITAHSSSNPFPKFEQLAQFLHIRARALRRSTTERDLNSKITSSTKPLPGYKRNYHTAFGTGETLICPLCSGPHSIRKCFKFKAKTPFERFEVTRCLGFCFNRLGHHKFSDCKSEGLCIVCGGKHHKCSIT